MRSLRSLAVIWALFGLLACAGCSAEEPPQKECPDCKPKRQRDYPKNYTWKPHNKNQDLLLLDGVPLGAWDHPSQTFTEWDGKKWGRTNQPCPIECPLRFERLPTGFEAKGMKGKGEHFQIDGKEVGRDEAFLLFQSPCPICPKPKGPVAPKGEQPYVTVISSDKEKREAVRSAWFTEPRFEAARDKIALWTVPPGHWSLDPGFAQKDGSIQLLAGDGTSLHRQETLDLANLCEAIRRRIPDYDPRKDIDFGRGARSWFSSGLDSILEVAALAFVGLVLLLILLVLLIRR